MLEASLFTAELGFRVRYEIPVKVNDFIAAVPSLHGVSCLDLRFKSVILVVFTWTRANTPDGYIVFIISSLSKDVVSHINAFGEADIIPG